MKNKLTCQECDKVLAEFEGEFHVYGDMTLQCPDCTLKQKVANIQ